MEVTGTIGAGGGAAAGAAGDVTGGIAGVGAGGTGGDVWARATVAMPALATNKSARRRVGLQFIEPCQ
jgi:hypothetical protein